MYLKTIKKIEKKPARSARKKTNVPLHNEQMLRAYCPIIYILGLQDHVLFGLLHWKSKIQNSWILSGIICFNCNFWMLCFNCSWSFGMVVKNFNISFCEKKSYEINSFQDSSLKLSVTFMQEISISKNFENFPYHEFYLSCNNCAAALNC